MFAFTIIDVVIAFSVAGVAAIIAVYEDSLTKLCRGQALRPQLTISSSVPSDGFSSQP
jgi:hypothetical protein